MVNRSVLFIRSAAFDARRRQRQHGLNDMHTTNTLTPIETETQAEAEIERENCRKWWKEYKLICHFTMDNIFVLERFEKGSRCVCERKLLRLLKLYTRTDS